MSTRRLGLTVPPIFASAVAVALLAGCMHGSEQTALPAAGTAQGALRAPVTLTATPTPTQPTPTPTPPAYSVLYPFAGPPNDGEYSYAGLTALNGTLYGTTYEGGANDLGTVFAIAPNGSEHVVYSFKGGSDGEFPQAGLVALNGKLYGTTFFGGGCTAGTCGTVFEVTTSGQEHVVYAFKSYPGDGGYPLAGLVAYKGDLYGTTEEGGGLCSGGIQGCGTVFKVSPSGEEAVVYTFHGGTDGAFPLAPLTLLDGKFYGTTNIGGSNLYGTVFEVSPSGSERVLHSFGAGSDGTAPSAGVTVRDHVLYGTTPDGGTAGYGTVFSITTAGRERVLHSFGAKSGDGLLPSSGLTLAGGVFYGTTVKGPGNAIAGTIFSIDPAGNETVVHAFGSGNDGTTPQAGLTELNGILYGTTHNGGASQFGVVYTIAP